MKKNKISTWKCFWKWHFLENRFCFFSLPHMWYKNLRALGNFVNVSHKKFSFLINFLWFYCSCRVIWARDENSCVHPTTPSCSSLWSLCARGFSHVTTLVLACRWLTCNWGPLTNTHTLSCESMGGLQLGATTKHTHTHPIVASRWSTCNQGTSTNTHPLVASRWFTCN